ncbi:hypothetical protein [Salinicola peritrichatus]|uniref:hypothetical protein n=1 Tax=Salinicola peritrichatus TaxID=1267424 RepID=UPI000DA12DBD|nr:hypothetical protein [Salinicola peritrichatus]
MKLSELEKQIPLTKKKRQQREDSLASLAKQAGMPVGTLKTRIKKFMDEGNDRQLAIQKALSRPIGPQGRPRQSGR